MVFAVPQRILLICLLHCCTFAVSQTVDPRTLMKIVKNFENRFSGMGQYAVAFRVEMNKCLNSSYNGRELITPEVIATLQRNEVYRNNNLIAAKADKIQQHHSEFRLKNYLKNVLNVTQKCVVYFTVSSPCLRKCLSETGQSSIIGNLRALENYVGIKAFAFKKVWEYDQREAVISRLMEIAPNLPYYQCVRNQAQCNRL